MKSHGTVRGAAALLLTTAVAALNAAPAAAQRDDVPDNDPSLCPYCEGDPERMAAAGVVSHGGFEFAEHDTKYVDGFLATADIHWIETDHFEIGMALPPYKVPVSDKNRIRAELTELAETLPEINPRKTRVLDPWLRAHMFGVRAEKAYDRFLEIIQREEEDFPGPDDEWLVGEPYMGEGRHLGQAGKFEIMFLPSEALFTSFLTHEFGLPMKKTQRWNVVARDTLTIATHPQQSSSLREDLAMYGHMVFNLAHNFLDGYKHYSYDTPIWLHEGLAHFMEREVSPHFNSFDSSEGGVAEETRKWKWKDEVHDMVRKEEAPRLAELLALKNYASMDLEDHYATWSMVSYLIERHPDAFAKILDQLTGLVNEQSIPDGSNMNDHHRDAFRDHLGMSYFEFDAAWREWAMGLAPDPEDTALPPGPGLGSDG